MSNVFSPAKAEGFRYVNVHIPLERAIHGVAVIIADKGFSRQDAKYINDAEGWTFNDEEYGQVFRMRLQKRPLYDAHARAEHLAALRDGLRRLQHLHPPSEGAFKRRFSHLSFDALEQWDTGELSAVAEAAQNRVESFHAAFGRGYVAGGQERALICLLHDVPLHAREASVLLELEPGERLVPVQAPDVPITRTF